MSPPSVKKSADNMTARRKTGTMSARHGRTREVEDPRVTKVRLLFHRKTEERRLYMGELKELREDKYRKVFKSIRKSIGPTWYQVLTQKHHKSLDTLRQGIHQGLLEGRATHALKVLKALSIYPTPHAVDVFQCMDESHRNPMEFLSRLFYLMYEHDLAAKRHEYDYNARMLLSSIFYLGLPGLKTILTQQFWPDRDWPEPPPEPRRKPPPPHPSPYLRSMKVPLYDPQPKRRKPPPPLPDLSFLDNPIEDIPARPRPPPPPPPPPPPKKVVPLPYCYRLADYRPIHLDPKWKTYYPTASKTDISRRMTLKKSMYLKKKRPSKMCLHTEKKTYRSILPPRKVPKPKLIAPKTGIDNEQYHLMGVMYHNDRTYYILGSVVRLPPQGHMIHGGMVVYGGFTFLWHMGIVSVSPTVTETECNCLEVMHDTVMKYVEKSKCTCFHRFDFKNALSGVPDEDDPEPYFKKPTTKGPFEFDYEAIYQEKPEDEEVRKNMLKIWDEESVLIMVNPDEKDPDKIAESQKKQKKKESKMYREPSPTCLGNAPKLEDYLRCALRQVRGLNIAARLPEVYLTRELIEWMRKRLHGPCTRERRENSVSGASSRFTYLKSFEKMGLGVAKFFPYPYYFTKRCTWASKPKLHRLFEEFKQEYRIKVYTAQAYFNNMLWATMDTAEFPNPNFRRCYWAYMIGRVSEVVVTNPYSPVESMARAIRMRKKRYKCLPKGALDVE